MWKRAFSVAAIGGVLGACGSSSSVPTPGVGGGAGAGGSGTAGAGGSGGGTTSSAGGGGDHDASVVSDATAGGGGRPAAEGGDARAEGAVDAGDGEAGTRTDDAATANLPFTPCATMGISQVQSVAYLPDGSGVIAGLGGSVAKLLDPKDAREVRSFVGHAGAINAVAVSADGATLVTASDDRTVRTWRVSDGALLTTFVARDYQLVSVAISPDGTRIAAGAFDGELFLWNRDGSLVAAATVPLDAGTNRLDGGPHLLPVQGVVFAAAGTRIFTTGAQGLRIFSATDLAPIANPRSFVVMGALAVSPDGDHVASGDTQYAISLWRASDGTLERQIPAGGAIGLLRYAPDGARVYAVVSGAKVNAFPVDGSPSTSIIEPIGGSPTVVAVAPNGHELFVASPWTTFLVDDAGNSLRAEIQEGPFAQSIAFSPDGARLLIGGDFGLVTRSVPGGEVANAIDWGQTSPRYSAVAFSPDGTLVATGDNDGALELWSTATWTKTKDVDKATIRVNSVAFSPDGKLLASVGDDSFEEVYRAPSGDFVTNLGLGGGASSIAFSHDGALVATGGVAILRTSDWSEVVSTTDSLSSTSELAFFPDGRTLAGSGGDHVSLWPTDGTSTRRDLLSIPYFRGSTVDVAPDGTLLAAGGYDGAVKLWSLPNMIALTDLPAHGTALVRTRFSPDSRRIAAAYSDGTVWLWCRR